MKTFLLTWNPKSWSWDTIEQDIKNIKKTGSTILQWSIVNHSCNKIQIGDRVFLLRLGKPPKGIMAAGFVTSLPFIEEHWKDKSKKAYRVMINFETILNPNSDKLLSLEVLKNDLPNIYWPRHSSGTEIDADLTLEVEQYWLNFLQQQNKKFDISLNPPDLFVEGSTNEVLTTIYERNPFARKACIDHFGLSCQICGFNFEEKYGEIGKDFIHVHHLNKISEQQGEYIINPIEDLIPVCPNCHSMLHKRKEPFTIEELRSKIIKD